MVFWFIISSYLVIEGRAVDAAPPRFGGLAVACGGIAGLATNEWCGGCACEWVPIVAMGSDANQCDDRIELVSAGVLALFPSGVKIVGYCDLVSGSAGGGDSGECFNECEFIGVHRSVSYLD
jgi:hypothetical protein